VHALDDEPETQGRWRRLGAGGIVCGVLAVSLAVAAQRIQPVARAFHSVVEIGLVEEPPEPPKKVEPPPPPLEQPKPRPVKQQPAAQPQPPTDLPPPPSDQPPPAEQVGLDSDSFGSGAGGPAFAAGNTQMGTPTGYGAAPLPPPEAPKPPRLIEARKLTGTGVGYTDRARRLGIQGLMVIEADIDAKGRVTRAVVRGKLEPQLDEAARKAVMGWQFEPATRDGHPIASTKFLRVRFELQ
jgi:protein TonB